uniref:Uncharacterized protein n=1 Tax=Mola mola TaxID=94237 RepID=A0A3Q3VKS8_MOLML
MTPLTSFLLILLKVCSFYWMVVAMPTSCKLQGHLVESVHHRLQDLGGDFPLHCFPYNVNMSFPDSAFPAPKANHHQCRRALWVVYKSLQQVQLMMEDKTPVGEGGVPWNKRKLDVFQNLQHQLLEQGSCLDSEDLGVLSSYFSNVTAVVKQQESASCGWMALKRDLDKVLVSALQKHHACFTWRDAH